ncbi:FlgT C-terminal domain-containing protein [Thermodesulfobacteriota bacterium]
MILTHNRSLTAKIGAVSFVLFWAVFCLTLAGCARFSDVKEATKEYVDSFSTPGDHLKKKVGIVMFENKTLLKIDGLENKFMDYLLKTIQKECDEILFLKPGDAGYPEALIDLPQQLSGDIDNLYLATTGRQHGLNAVVAGTLTGVSEDQEKHGMLWFKSVRPYVRVQISAAIYDSETGAKLFDDSFNHRVEVEETESDLFEETEFKLSDLDSKTLDMALTEAFDEIAENMGEAICEALEDHPWRGFVTSVSDDKIIISSGKTAGLKPGDILDVYRTDDVYQGARDQRFFIPGLKTGEIKITIVSPDKSVAEVVSGQDIKPGSSVRPKK